MPRHGDLGFGVLVGRRRHAQRLAVRELGPKPLVEQLAIVADQRIG
ncbi:MAG TPA: hypothetical protein VKV24_16450 [Casimicrobiaceae bacterium]|nr:hypothetical protein [Casimicrobiaceae bacterium]